MEEHRVGRPAGCALRGIAVLGGVVLAVAAGVLAVYLYVVHQWGEKLSEADRYTDSLNSPAITRALRTGLEDGRLMESEVRAAVARRYSVYRGPRSLTITTYSEVEGREGTCFAYVLELPAGPDSWISGAPRPLADCAALRGAPESPGPDRDLLAPGA